MRLNNALCMSDHGKQDIDNLNTFRRLPVTTLSMVIFLLQNQCFA